MPFQVGDRVILKAINRPALSVSSGTPAYFLGILSGRRMKCCLSMSKQHEWFAVDIEDVSKVIDHITNKVVHQYDARTGL